MSSAAQGRGGRRGRWAGVVVVLLLLLGGGVFLAGRMRAGAGAGGKNPLDFVSDAAEDMVEEIEELFEHRYDTRAPFDAVRWEGGLPQVEVDGVWYQLKAVDGWEIEPLLAYTRSTYGAGRVEKRFEEDLVEVMSRGWKAPGPEVVLKVKPVAGGEEKEIKSAMTEARRNTLWKARGGGDLASLRAQMAGGGGPVGDPKAALEALVRVMAESHSYTVALGKEEELSAAVAREITKKPGPGEVELAVLRVLGASVDGHAGLEGASPLDAGPFVPWLLVPVGDEEGTGIVAVEPDRSGFLDRERPFVVSVNGVGIEELLKRAQEYVADGSKALVRERACRVLRSAMVAGANAEKVTVELAKDAGGAEKMAVVLAVTQAKPVYGEWPKRGTGWIEEGKVGYLRLAEMKASATEEIAAALEKFEDAQGLVIDVRGNGGGRRDALLMLASRLMAKDAKPLVYNAARPIRLPRESDEQMDERMQSRFMARGDGRGWSSAELEAIKAFAAGFQVKDARVKFDDARFGPWYYGVVAPDARRTWMKPGKRVVVLMDNVCFSATDVFLMAMGEIEGVTLVGRPSAGGSGLAQEHRVGDGALKVRLSSMVSFRPDGVMVDGNGVVPDVVVWPKAWDLVNGGGDSVLEEAVRVVKGRAAK